MCPYGRVFLMSILYGQFLQPSASASLEDCALSFLPSGLSIRRQMKIEITPYLSQKIRNISLLAILMVLVQHGSYGLSNTGWHGVFKNVISLGICDFPVSFFFIVSGFFLARNFTFTWSWYSCAMSKRVKSLLIPYLIYSALGFLLWGVTTRGSFLDGLGITSLLPVVGPLWYVRTLIALCIISPVIIIATRSASKHISACLFLAAIFIAACIFPFPARKSLGMSTLYFSFGTFLAAYGQCFPKIPAKIKFAGGVVALLALLIFKAIHEAQATQPTSEVFLRWYIVPVTICTIWYGYDVLFKGKLLQQPSFLSFATQSTFFIYCSESFIRFGFCKVITILGIGSLINSPQGAISFAVIIAVTSLFLSRCLGQLSPRLYKTISGGR